MVGAVEHARLDVLLAPAPEVAVRDAGRHRERAAMVGFDHPQVLRPVVAAGRDGDIAADVERPRDRLGARLEGVLDAGAVVPRHLHRHVGLARRQIAVRRVVEERARVRLHLADAAPGQPLRLEERRPIDEVPPDAGAAHESHVGLEALVDVHERVPAGAGGCLPSRSTPWRCPGRASSPGVSERATKPFRLRLLSTRKLASTPATRL